MLFSFTSQHTKIELFLAMIKDAVRCYEVATSGVQYSSHVVSDHYFIIYIRSMNYFTLQDCILRILF